MTRLPSIGTDVVVEVLQMLGIFWRADATV